jgi:hypothetical protein
MKIRACGIALLIGASIASPHGIGESNAQDRERSIAATQEQEVLLVGAVEWTAPEWDYSDQLIDPSLRAAQRGSRNPAGLLVLPAPQTSHAPAF